MTDEHVTVLILSSSRSSEFQLGSRPMCNQNVNVNAWKLKLRHLLDIARFTN